MDLVQLTNERNSEIVSQDVPDYNRDEGIFILLGSYFKKEKLLFGILLSWVKPTNKKLVIKQRNTAKQSYIDDVLLIFSLAILLINKHFEGSCELLSLNIILMLTIMLMLLINC